MTGPDDDLERRLCGHYRSLSAVLPDGVAEAANTRLSQAHRPFGTTVLMLAALTATVLGGTAIAIGQLRTPDAPVIRHRPSSDPTPQTPSASRDFQTRSKPGQVLRVTGPGLGRVIEAFRNDLLYVVDVTDDRGVAAYLIEGPPRSHSEDASRTSVPAALVDANTTAAELECPEAPRSLSELEYLPPFARMLCFHQPVTLENVWVEAATDGQADHGPSSSTFLSGYAEVGSGTLPFVVTPGSTIDGPGWVTVTGRFGQTDAACGDAFSALRCRERLLVEEVREGSSPFSVLSGSWSRMSPSPIDGRSDYVAVRTDQGAVIWGGEPASSASQAAIYDAVRDRWSDATSSPGRGRVGAASAWSGSEVLIWGGASGAMLYDDGFSYDPSADRWAPIPAAPIVAGYGDGAWTGEEFVVISSTAQSAAWDPTNRQWRRLPDPPLPPGAMEAVWTGRALIVLAIGEGGLEPVVGATLDASTWTWRTIADVPYDGLILGVQPSWTGSQMLFAGHAYDPTTDRWRVLRRDGCVDRNVSVGVWTGRLLINQVQAFDPAQGRCHMLPEAPQRPGFEGIRTHEFHTPFWTDERLVVWSGGTGLDGPGSPPDGIVFRPDDP